MDSSAVVRHPFRVWLMGFVGLAGLCLAWAAVGAAPALAAGIIATDPMTNAVGVDLYTGVEATYDASIDTTTVTTRTFVVHGMMSGRRDGGFSFSGDTKFKFVADEGYFPGEVVRVSATGGVHDAGGDKTEPYQWQFTAGPVYYWPVSGWFTDIDAGLPGMFRCSVAWGDYDNDGDLDFLLTGFTVTERINRIYRNNGDGSFTDIEAGLPGVGCSSAAWGDYDNDGDLDILLAGLCGRPFSGPDLPQRERRASEDLPANAAEELHGQGLNEPWSGNSPWAGAAKHIVAHRQPRCFADPSWRSGTWLSSRPLPARTHALRQPGHQRGRVRRLVLPGLSCGGPAVWGENSLPLVILSEEVRYFALLSMTSRRLRQFPPSGPCSARCSSIATNRVHESRASTEDDIKKI